MRVVIKVTNNSGEKEDFLSSDYLDGGKLFIESESRDVSLYSRESPLLNRHWLLVFLMSSCISLASDQSLTLRSNSFRLLELFLLYSYLGQERSYDPIVSTGMPVDEISYSWALSQTTSEDLFVYLCSTSQSPLHFLEMNGVEQTIMGELVFYKISVNQDEEALSGQKKLSLMNPQDLLRACSGLKVGSHTLPLGVETSVLTDNVWDEVDKVRLNINRDYWQLNSAGGYQTVIEAPLKSKKGQRRGDKVSLLAAEGGESSEPEKKERPKKNKKEASKSGEDPNRPPPREDEGEKAELLVSLESQLFDLLQQPENIEFLAQQLMAEFSVQPEGLALFVQMHGLDEIVGLSQGYSIDVWRKLLLWLKDNGKTVVGSFLRHFYVGEQPDERLKRAIVNAVSQASVSNTQVFTHPVSEISNVAMAMFPGVLPEFINQFADQQQIPLPGHYSVLTWVVILHWLQSHPGAVAQWMSIATMRNSRGKMQKLKDYIRPSERPREPGP
ncbi:hypothetical protein [Endozoicomonas numazuensis]|uniref:Uncharacterized protein n=1 Tax=Endozoicomonas numazuensis TaxID=1137799 RepID=A0A081NEY2_9GAMM|nr:hypothetical protein [Endozoicomonas numazuensis]KEQ17005.1 hypothetical protein GZ78_20520 [Endozoicomonas numazuensis]